VAVVGDLQVHGPGIGHARRGAGPGVADLDLGDGLALRVGSIVGGGGVVVTTGRHQSGDGENGDRGTEGAAGGMDGGHACSSSSRILRSEVIASLSNPNGHSTTTVPVSSTT